MGSTPRNASGSNFRLSTATLSYSSWSGFLVSSFGLCCEGTPIRNSVPSTVRSWYGIRDDKVPAYFVFLTALVRCNNGLCLSGKLWVFGMGDHRQCGGRWEMHEAGAFALDGIAPKCVDPCGSSSNILHHIEIFEFTRLLAYGHEDFHEGRFLRQR